MKALRKFVALLPFASALAVAICGCESSPPSRASAETPTPLPRIVRQSDGIAVLQFPEQHIRGITTLDLREAILPGVLEASGQISFDDRRVSSIVSRVSGRIEQTRISQWDVVRRGEPIVKLYSPDLMTAEAEYLQAKTTLTLGNSPQIGGSTLAGSLLSAAQRKLELLGMSDGDIAAITAPDPSAWIRAPIGGIVIDNKAVRGSAVNPGDVLYSLGTLNDVWIVADIYESDLSRITTGQRMEAVTTAYPQETFSGFISRISPSIDPNTHTLEIRCEVANPHFELKPQMLATVKIITPPGSALIVPQAALVFDTSNYYAFVEISPGLFERRVVSVTSWNKPGMVRVLSGLQGGDRVVVGESMQVNALWHEAHSDNSET